MLIAPTLRLSPFMAVIPVGSGFLFRSDLKSFALTGDGVTAFVRRILPFLDGAYDAESIACALPDFDHDSTLSVLADLERIGVLERSNTSPDSADERQHGNLAGFFRYWSPDSTLMTAAIDSAHVAIIGLNDSAAIAGEQLARAGVGRLTVLDAPSRGRNRLNGGWSASRLVNRLRKVQSRSVLANGATRIENGLLDLPVDDVTLLLVTLGVDDLQLLDALARTAHHRKIRYMVAHVDGLSAMLGPVVMPGETACWECLRRRTLANQSSVDESAMLQSALLSGETAARKSLALPGTASVLGGLISLETIKVISGYAPSPLVGRQLEFSLVTHEAKMHSIVRLPWCSICGGSASASEAFRERASLHRNGDDPRNSTTDLSTALEPAELRKALGGWVDNRTGVVRNLVLNDSAPDQPQTVHTATAVIAAHGIPGHRSSDSLIGSGKSTTRVGAMVGAVGEAIERYSASIYLESDLMRASPNSIGRDGFDPAALTLYLPRQYATAGFPYDRFDRAKEISWTEGVWLESGKKVFVPALPTYFNYHAPHGEQFCQVTSNGLAAGSSFEDAALRATLELIERDAFMMTWLQRRQPRRLDVGAELGADVADVLSEFGELGMEVELYLMKSDVRVPSVMCLSWGDGKTRPAATVALAAHFDPVEAVRKAILEQAHVGPYIARLMSDEHQKIPRRALDVRTLNDHALFYVPRKRLAAFDFIRARGGKPFPLSRIKRPSSSGIDACTAALADGGFRVAVVDVTAPDVALGPFRVARALGTYLQPIDFGHQQRRLANPRLWSNGRQITRHPHPLA